MSRPETSDRASLDQAVSTLAEHKRAFARLNPKAKKELLRRCIPRLLGQAEHWADAGTRAKGLPPAQTGEEWLVGPFPTIRMMRLVAQSLASIAKRNKPPFGLGRRRNEFGQIEVDVFPADLLDRPVAFGFRGFVALQDGISEERARTLQAAFYEESDPPGGVALILGAGNVASIPPMDVMTKMFAEGRVCLLKLNPVNEWVGRFLIDVFEPLIERGFLRIVYGGADVGAYLIEHPLIDEVHMTGSDKTHDRIVWGPEGPERDRRKRDNDPLFKKPISSELGNVSPVALAPYRYSPSELDFMAKNVVSMVANNASFNCNAAKILILSSGWAQKSEFLDLIRDAFRQVPVRDAYYPGARERYDTLLDGRTDVERFGIPNKNQLAWALVQDVDANNPNEPLFQIEPFCGILSVTELPHHDFDEFMDQATAFMNERIWGTLSATLLLPDSLVNHAATRRAVRNLRYGTVTINHWPGVTYGLVSLPWGGHPSATLSNIQSGLGWVHNSYFLGGIEKSVLVGPLVVRPKPIWFFDYPHAAKVGPKLVALEAGHKLSKLPGLIASSFGYAR